MASYFSTVAPGLEEIALAALRRRLRDVQVDLVGDGIVVYRSSYPRRAVRALEFFGSTFVLLRFFDHLPSDAPGGPAAWMAREILTDERLAERIAANLPDRPSTFRVIFREDRLVAVGEDLLRRLERAIADAGQVAVDRSRPELEFWLIARRQGFGLFGQRLTRHRDYAKLLQKGELRPDLAALICLLAEPARHDVFLDPFAGSGAIPIARARLAPYRRVIASDVDSTLVDKLKKRVKSTSNVVEVRQCDALSLAFLEPGSVDAIATDPPWGLHVGTDLDLPSLYDAMLNEFFRVLRPAGLAVVLLARNDTFERVLARRPDRFALVARYDTLVSGQKASIYKVRRPGMPSA